MSIDRGARALPCLTTLLLAFVLAPATPTPLAAQDNEDCLMCHEETDLTGTRDGREISVHVDPVTFTASIHSDFDCVMCHMDLEGTDIHDDDVEPVDCGMCHDGEMEAFEGSLHGRSGAATCGDCHGYHDTRPLAEERSRCETCHSTETRIHRRSLHGQAEARGNDRAPGCADCHGGHHIRPAAESGGRCGECHSTQARQHGRSLHGLAEARGDEMAPSCVDCHGGHEVTSASSQSSSTSVMNIPVLCGRCHQEGSPVNLSHDIPQDRILENYSMSIHGAGLFQRGLTVTAVCTSCHTSHDILPHTDPRSSIHHDNVAKTCAQCHGQIEQVHRKFIDGRLWEEEPHKIPACVECHEPHEIRRVFYPSGLASQDCLRCHSDPSLTMNRDGETVSLHLNQEVFIASAHGGTACAQCHTNVSPSMERPCETVESKVDCSICHAEPVNDYMSGIHGLYAAESDPDAPTCLDCHGKHDILKQTVPTSTTFPQNVPLLCSKCHRLGEQAAARIDSEVPDIYQSYLDSIHGKGLLESGLLVTATCADCHTAHGELPPTDERSSVHFENIPDTCGQCHHGIEETFKKSVHWSEDPDAQHRYPSCEDCHTSHTISRVDQGDFRFTMMGQCGRCHQDEAETFFDTFHGKVSRLGAAGAAKCYDCHGTHDILPSSDPESALGRDNVVETCGQCHEGSHRRFAGYLTHATHHDQEKYPWLFWSFWFMTCLLVGTLTFALLHTLAWLVRLWLSRDEWKAHKALAHAGTQKVYRRFNLFNRVLHLSMLISFFTLALTGMTLKFSYMSWAQGFSWLLGGFGTMGVLHRLGAIILFVIFVLHFWYILDYKKRTQRSWWQIVTGPHSILFNKRDLEDFPQSIRWFFGMGPRPAYGRYTYWEKFDYFAVLWGIMIIGSTGLVLWFPEIFTWILPGWSVNVATIIHSDEALLAVGFIFTIHFFNTHFRPDKFPMDQVIFTGEVALDELKYDKPGEYQELVESGDLEQHLVKPFKRPYEKLIRIFAFTALGVGLILIALIVYTMLFGYR